MTRDLRERLSHWSQGIMPEGWKMNPDGARVEKILDAIERNSGYCPCVAERSYETLCRCNSFRNGEGCHCGLYVVQ